MNDCAIPDSFEIPRVGLRPFFSFGSSVKVVTHQLRSVTVGSSETVNQGVYFEYEHKPAGPDKTGNVPRPSVERDQPS
jgi:hypothetical protein